MFVTDWKEVEDRVSGYSSLSEEVGVFLDKEFEIEKEDIAKYIIKLKNNKTGGSHGIVGELL